MIGKMIQNSDQKMNGKLSSASASALAVSPVVFVSLGSFAGRDKVVGRGRVVGQGKAAGQDRAAGQDKAAGRVSFLSILFKGYLLIFVHTDFYKRDITIQGDVSFTIKFFILAKLPAAAFYLLAVYTYTRGNLPSIRR